MKDRSGQSGSGRPHRAKREPPKDRPLRNPQSDTKGVGARKTPKGPSGNGPNEGNRKKPDGNH